MSEDRTEIEPVGNFGSVLENIDNITSAINRLIPRSGEACTELLSSIKHSIMTGLVSMATEAEQIILDFDDSGKGSYDVQVKLLELTHTETHRLLSNIDKVFTTFKSKIRTQLKSLPDRSEVLNSLLNQLRVEVFKIPPPILTAKIGADVVEFLPEKEKSSVNLSSELILLIATSSNRSFIENIEFLEGFFNSVIKDSSLGPEWIYNNKYFASFYVQRLLSFDGIEEINFPTRYEINPLVEKYIKGISLVFSSLMTHMSNLETAERAMQIYLKIEENIPEWSSFVASGLVNALRKQPDQNLAEYINLVTQNIDELEEGDLKNKMIPVIDTWISILTDYSGMLFLDSNDVLNRINSIDLADESISNNFKTLSNSSNTKWEFQIEESDGEIYGQVESLFLTKTNIEGQYTLQINFYQSEESKFINDEIVIHKQLGKLLLATINTNDELYIVPHLLNYEKNADIETFISKIFNKVFKNIIEQEESTVRKTIPASRRGINTSRVRPRASKLAYSIDNQIQAANATRNKQIIYDGSIEPKFEALLKNYKLNGGKSNTIIKKVVGVGDNLWEIKKFGSPLRIMLALRNFESGKQFECLAFCETKKDQIDFIRRYKSGTEA